MELICNMTNETKKTRKSKYRFFTRQEFEKSDLWEKVQSYSPPFYLNSILTPSEEDDLVSDSIGLKGYIAWTHYDEVVAYDCRKCNGIVSGQPLLKEDDLDDFFISCRKCRKSMDGLDLYEY